MNEHIQNYYNTSMEIALCTFRISRAAALLLKMLSAMKKQVKICNKSGRVTSVNVTAVSVYREEIARCVFIIKNETRLAQEASSSFMRISDDLGRQHPAGQPK